MPYPVTSKWFTAIFRNRGELDSSQKAIFDKDISASILKWVMALMFSAVIGLILLAGFAKIQIENVYHKAIFSNTSTVPGVVAIEEAKVHLVLIGELIYRHVYNDNSEEKAEFERKIVQDLAISLEYLEEYAYLITSEADKRMLKHDKTIYVRYQQKLALTLRDSRANRLDVAKLNLLVLDDIKQSLMHTLDTHIRSNIEVGDTSRSLAENSLSKSIWRSILFVTGLIAILLLLGYSIGKRLLQQTSKLQLLERESTMFRNMVDQLDNVAVTVHDTNNGSRVIYANDAARNHFGINIETLVTWTPKDFQAKVDDEGTAVAIVQKVTEDSVTFETFHRTISGKVIPVEVVSNVFKHEGQELNLCFTSNISERKTAANAIEAALAEAKRLAQLRSEFIAKMSHELRTPLNGILGYAQLLQRKVGLSEQQVTGLNVIQQSGEHLLMLINDILDFSKVEANKLQLNFSEIQLDQFMHSLTSMIGIKAEQKQLAFILEMEDLPDVIRADDKRLRQVLLNLLGNAVKFTSHGQIYLRVKLLSPTMLRFEVQDTGSGINENQLETIFQPFEQTSNAKQWVEGTGLGLAISRQLARLMGSDIQVKSQITQGSTFWFDLELPVDGIQLAIKNSQRNVIGYKRQKKTSMVINGVFSKRTVVANITGQIGFELPEAGNGLRKMQVLQQDAILNDQLVLPPQAKLEELHFLALRGNMQDIKKWAISLAELDKCYHPITEHIQLLVKEFQSK
ncbi:MAG: PAS domain-containing protein, partial [Candidatus Saccharibacteria bacterium]|nr:PAS domain-containing protein [Moraxellaceae bacterium]